MNGTRRMMAACVGFVAVVGVATAAWGQTTVSEFWIRTEGGTLDDFARAVAVDSGGNIYVTGQITTAPNQTAFATMKYDPLGNAAWFGGLRTYPNGGAVAIVVDQVNGFVYVTGSAIGNGTGQDYITIKYDLINGNPSTTWLDLGDGVGVRRYNNPGVNGNDIAQGIDIDDLGNVYVTGTSYGGSTAGNDYATIAYNASGGLLWSSMWANGVRRYNNAAVAGGQDTPVAIKVERGSSLGPQGRFVYVTGTSDGGASFRDFATVAYDRVTGNDVWTPGVRRFNGSANGDDIAAGLAVSTAVFITGYTLHDNACCGRPLAPANQDYLTIRYDRDGTLRWVTTYDGPDHGSDFAVAIVAGVRPFPLSDAVWVTGYSWSSATSYDYLTFQYDAATGLPNPAWQNGVRFGGTGQERAVALVLGEKEPGFVYVTGWTLSTPTTDWVTLKYDDLGNMIWSIIHNGPANGQDSPAAIALDQDEFSAPNSHPKPIVVGAVIGVGTGNDFRTIKYRQDP